MYKPNKLAATATTPLAAIISSFDNTINLVLDSNKGLEVLQQGDEYTEWLREPA